MKIRIAVAPTPEPVDRDGFVAFIDGLEARGFDTVWLSDVPLGNTVDPLLGLAIAAGRTTRLKLGTNLVVPGRNPMLMAKELAQLDRLTGGRLLLSFVPGIGDPIEKAALGAEKLHRGRLIDHAIGLCRQWWAGEAVTDTVGDCRFDGVVLSPTPIQDPLEIWLGGIGPQALDRAGRLADGWLTARATPEQAAAGRVTIERAAADAGRTIDGEHFGISIPYARAEPDPKLVAGTMRRAEGADRVDILPIGRDELVSLLERHIAGGLTKFVLRPLTFEGWDAELDWLAEVALPLQS